MNITEGWQRLLVERDGQALIATMNRPEQLNAVDDTMHHELEEFFRRVDDDDDSRVVILTGAGRGFCSGGDVGGMKDESGTPIKQRTDAVHSGGWHLVYTILATEKPVIAMVNGAAVGLGATMALLCDAVFMAENAKIGDRHVNVGLVAGDGGGVVWPLLIGVMKSKQYLMTGDLLTGSEAAGLGLITKAVAPDDLRAETMKYAEKLAALPPYALRATKAMLNRYLRWMANESLETSLAWEHLSMKTEDHHEAVAAFLEKRTGAYTGR